MDKLEEPRDKPTAIKQARQQTEERLRVSEAPCRLLAENASDVIWTMSLDGRITYVSPSVERLRGFTPEEAMQQTLDEIQTPESQAITLDYFSRMAGLLQAGRPLERARYEIEYRCKDGSTIWCDVHVLPVYTTDGIPVELLGISRDINAVKRAESEAKLVQAREADETANRALQRANADLQRLAVMDHITGVWNRVYFEAAVGAEIARVARYGAPVSLLLLDIDLFKAINDAHGHLVGDRILIEG